MNKKRNHCEVQNSTSVSEDNVLNLGVTKNTMIQKDHSRVTQATKNVQPQIRDDNWSLLLTTIGDSQDRKAFYEFFQHFAPMIKGYFLSKSGASMNESMADELIQEVMLKVWQKADKFDSSKSAASTWLFTLARNTRIDMIRRQAKHNLEVIETEDIWPDDEEASPVARLQQNRDEKKILHSLSQLPIEQAQVVRKVYLEGKTHTTVSEELQLPLGTVKSRLRLALVRMRLVFGQHSHELEL